MVAETEGLREKAGVSGEAMNMAYQGMKTLSIEQLQKMRTEAFSSTGDSDHINLLVHQIDLVIDRKQKGIW